jgi:hypothetical protein
MKSIRFRVTWPFQLAMDDSLYELLRDLPQDTVHCAVCGICPIWGVAYFDSYGTSNTERGVVATLDNAWNIRSGLVSLSAPACPDNSPAFMDKAA